jgi:hypothetical protein
MHVYEIVGYVEGECDLVCPDCVNDAANADPVFAGSEWDYQPTCDTCHTELDVVVLHENDGPEDDGLEDE